MSRSREQIDRISTAGRDFIGWVIFGLAMLLVVVHALNLHWVESLKYLVLAVAICPLVPIAFEVRVPIAMFILLVAT